MLNFCPSRRNNIYDLYPHEVAPMNHVQKLGFVNAKFIPVEVKYQPRIILQNITLYGLDFGYYWRHIVPVIFYIYCTT